MYFPPLILVALLQVSGPNGGDQVSAIHQPNPMPVVVKNVNLEKPEKPLTQKLAKPDTSTTAATRESRMNASNDLIRQRQKTIEESNPGDQIPEIPVPAMDSATPQSRRPGFGSFVSPETGTSFSKFDPATNTIEINTALVKPEKEIVISAGIQGNLTRLRVNQKDPVTGADLLDADGFPLQIEVREGQNVSAGEEIGTIDDSIELRQIAAAEALLKVAYAEQNKLIEVEYAKAAWTVAIAEVEKNSAMNKLVPNTVSDQMVLEAKLRKIQAQKQYEKAVYDLKIVKPAETNVKEEELGIAKTRLKQRRLVSPVNGIVDEMSGHEGEWFREGDPILKITQYDTLRVNGRINLDHATPRMVDGKSVSVVAAPIGKEPPLSFTGKVVFVSQSIEGDRHFKILVEVKNQIKDGYWLLNPGRFVDMKIQL